MTLLLRNATLVDPHAGFVGTGSLLIDGGVIIGTQPDQTRPATAEVVECNGRIVMPALVNGHTHLYSALALGMPPPSVNPSNFVEILEQVWWKLDSVLDEESVYMSALAGAARAALCGCATMVDHHASPNAIQGSLDLVAKALSVVGLRGVLCYETTDRHGLEGARRGVEENARFLRSIDRNGRLAGMVGAHASFTLGDSSLGLLSELATECDVGVHIHCGEDMADLQDSYRRVGVHLIQRLRDHGIIRPGTLLAHCTHLSPGMVRDVVSAGCWVAHNPRSNMNNAVGYAPVQSLACGKLMLGTDGIDGDLFAESKAAWFKSRDARTGLGADAILHMAMAAADFASERLGINIGTLTQGAAADLVILNYDSFTPIHAGNLLGHWFFGLGARHVDALMVAGEWVVRNGELVSNSAKSELERCPQVSANLWKRFEG